MATNPLFLDTTIQVDRLFEEHDPERMRAIEDLLGQYQYLVASTFSRLEYKRVVLQNLALCLRHIVEEGSFFRALARAKAQIQLRPRRVATLISIYSWLGMKGSGSQEAEVGGTIDEQLKLQSETYLGGV